MPRGRPKGSKNKTKKQKQIKAQLLKSRGPATFAPDTQETDAQIEARIKERFAVMNLMAGSTIVGKNRAMIISGPPGLGKSFGVSKMCEALLEKGYESKSIQGFVRPTGLFKSLYECRGKKQVLVLDDADSVFADEITLNLLKVACDTTRSRTISWLAESKMEDEFGEKLPRSFDFEGSVIFITNLDFDQIIEREGRLAPHMAALISRCHYLDLALKSKRDYIIRITQVLKEGMLEDLGLDQEDEDILMDYIKTNAERLRELSLRMVLKLANLMLMNRKSGRSWQSIANITCLRNG